MRLMPGPFRCERHLPGRGCQANGSLRRTLAPEDREIPLASVANDINQLPAGIQSAGDVLQALGSRLVRVRPVAQVGNHRIMLTPGSVRALFGPGRVPFEICQES